MSLDVEQNFNETQHITARIREHLLEMGLYTKLCGLFDVAEDFYSYFIVDIVENFYQQDKTSDFEEYLKVYIVAEKYKLTKNYTIFWGSLEHYTSEIDRISKILGKITPNIEILGDKHFNRMKFKLDNKVYTEKSVLNQDILINAIGKTLPEFSQYFCESTETENFFIRDFVETKTTNINNKDFFYHFGKCIALTTFFRAIDMHYENIITTSKGIPLLVDFEYIMFPDYIAKRFGKYTLRKTSIIDYRTDGNNSALFGGLYKDRTLLTPLIHIEDKKPYIVWEKAFINKMHSNIPHDLEVHPNIYRTQLIEGFNDAGKTLISNKESIKDMLTETPINTRLIGRPTSMYLYILMYTNYLYKMNLDAKSFIKEQLVNLKILPLYEIDLETYIEEELKDLMIGLVPFLYANTNSREVYTPRGVPIGKLQEAQIMTQRRHIDEYEVNKNKYIGSLKRALTVNHEAYKIYTK